MDPQHVIANCNGTLVKVPFSLVSKAQLLTILWESGLQTLKKDGDGDDVKDEEINIPPLMLDCSAADMRDLINRKCGKQRIDDYLNVDDGNPRLYDMSDKCEIKSYFSKENRCAVCEITFVMPGFDVCKKLFVTICGLNQTKYFGSIHGSDMSITDYSRQYPCEKVPYDDGKYIVFPTGTTYCLATSVDSRSKIYVDAEDVLEAIKVCAKKCGMTIGDYVMDKKLCLLNDGLGKRDPKSYGGTFFFDAKGGDSHMIIAELMYKNYSGLAYMLGLKLSTVTHMVELVDRVALIRSKRGKGK